MEEQSIKIIMIGTTKLRVSECRLNVLKSLLRGGEIITEKSTASSSPYMSDVEFSYQRQNCGTASASLAYRRSSSKEGFVSLVTLQDVQKVNCTRIFFCPHHLARGTGGLEANCRRGQPRSRQIGSPSPEMEKGLGESL